MANNYWEYGPGYPMGPVDNQYTDDSTWYGSGNTGMGNEWADARQRMTSDDAYRGRPSWMAGNPHVGFNMPAANTSKYIQRKEDTEPGFLKKTWEGAKNLAGNFTPLGVLNALTRRKGADQSFSGYKGSGFGTRTGLFPQEVANLERLSQRGLLADRGQDIFGTNVVSGGDYNKHIAERKGLFEGKLQDQDYMTRTFGNQADSIKTLEDLEEAYRTKYGKNAAIANRLNLYANFNKATGTGVDTVTDKITVTKPGDGVVATGDRGGGFNPVLDRPSHPSSRPSWHGATAAREARGETVAGPGGGQGAYWAEGGRVGYQDGELVEDEYMAEATPGGMMEENIEEVQGEPTREQLEAIALEIFRLPLEELNEEQLEVVYQAAMEQEPAEEEVQFAAQEGPGEGIASLV